MALDVDEDVLQRVGELLGVLHREAERRNEEDDVVVVTLHGRDDVLLAHPKNRKISPFLFSI